MEIDFEAVELTSPVGSVDIECRTYDTGHAKAINAQEREFSCIGSARGGQAVVTDQPAEKLVKIGANIVAHVHYVIFPDGRGRGVEDLFWEILRLIAEQRQPPPAPI
jgi:hypothetical protein